MEREEVVKEIEGNGWKVVFSVPSLTQARAAIEEILSTGSFSVKTLDRFPEYFRDGEIYSIVFRKPRTYYVVKKSAAVGV